MERQSDRALSHSPSSGGSAPLYYIRAVSLARRIQQWLNKVN